MDIGNFLTFCWVVEEGSITKAAKLGYVSQPAVTRKIRLLESHYGTKLFDRQGGKLKITEAGRLLYPYAKEIVALNKEAFDKVFQQLNKTGQTLRIGASLTIGEYLLPGLIGRFKEDNPNINFSLSIGNTPLILEKLDNNLIDMALIEGVFNKEDYTWSKFADDELILVAAYKHRWEKRESIQLDELPEEKMIWREKESGTREIVENALLEKNTTIKEKITNAMELGSLQAIKSAVEANLGVSILPKLTIQKELKYKLLCEVPIDSFQIIRNFWIVEKEKRFEKDIVKSFKKFLLR